MESCVVLLTFSQTSGSQVHLSPSNEYHISLDHSAARRSRDDAVLRATLHDPPCRFVGGASGRLSVPSVISHHLVRSADWIIQYWTRSHGIRIVRHGHWLGLGLRSPPAYFLRRSLMVWKPVRNGIASLLRFTGLRTSSLSKGTSTSRPSSRLGRCAGPPPKLSNLSA